MKKIDKSTCPFCASKRLYKIDAHTQKCSTCNKKYSLKKLEFDWLVLSCFCDDKSALECKDILSVNYKSIKDRYTQFRRLITHHAQEQYNKSEDRFSEYDEYYFLPKKKRGKVKYLFEAIGVLGMLYDDFVYTLLMPDQFAHLKDTDFGTKEVNVAYLKEYAHYLNRHKIMHFEKFDSPLIHFWAFLEQKLLKYKGINSENFIYYLKEYEFKFNYPCEQQKEILWSAWLADKKLGLA